MTTLPTRGALALAAALCAPAFAASSWPQPAYDAGQTYYNPGERTLKTSNVHKLKRLSQQAPGYIWLGQTTQAGGATFLCSDRYDLAAFDTATGALTWSNFDGLGGQCQAPVLGGTSVYASAWHTNEGTGSNFTNTLTALNQADGSVLWHVFGQLDPKDGRPSWLNFNPATLSQGILFVSNGRSLVSAYNADNGHLRWRDETGFLNNPMSAADGIAYTTTEGEGGGINFVLAHEAKRGFLVWSKPLDSSVTEYPATVTGGRVFATSDSGKVYAFDAAAGTPLWQAALPGWPSSPLAATPTTIYAAAAHTTLVALDASTGATLWTKQIGGAGYQFAGARHDDSTGDILIQANFDTTINLGGGALTSPPGDTDAVIARLDSSGNFLWQKQIGGPGYQTASVRLDSAGNWLVYGSFSNQINYGTGSIPGAGTSTDDVFVLKLDSSGNPLWFHRYGNSAYQYPSNGVVDATGHLILTGGYGGTINFGGSTTYTSPDPIYDVFLVKLSP